MEQLKIFWHHFKIFRKNRYVRYTITAIAVTAAALLQTFVIQTFIRPAGLLSGGFTGIAILIDMVTSLSGIQISTSLAMILLNIPVALICSRSISVKFTVFSLVEVFLASFFLQVLHFEPLFDDIILNVIFGGTLNGICTLAALRGNASTGGTDFIALYVSNKTGRSIWSYVFAGNVVLLLIFGAIFGWMYAGYSIIFQFISTRMVSAFHHRYERVTLQITTTKPQEVIKTYIKQYRHGISCVEAIGGYSKKKMSLLHTVVSSYEVNDIVHLISGVDEHVVINMLKTENFYGHFYRAPLD